jgi:hypothetical protein
MNMTGGPMSQCEWKYRILFSAFKKCQKFNLDRDSIVQCIQRQVSS